MLGKALHVPTVSSPLSMSPAGAWHKAARVAPVQARALWQQQADKFYCHPQAVRRVHPGYYCRGAEGSQRNTYLLQVMAGPWTAIHQVQSTQPKVEQFLWKSTACTRIAPQGKQ